jgi:putative transposase
MPRRRRGWLDKACYHVTHRCHKREFLFKFAKYRDLYIRQLWEMKQRFKVDILNYMITSNHVHLLLSARHGEDISEALQFLHGSVGQQYNLLKERQGAFWSGRFHATRIQTGEHLRRCMFYINLNMVRAGAVDSPGEWAHCAHHELLGQRQRYRVINMKRLLHGLDIPSVKQFKKWYSETLAEKLACISREREAYWSEAIAVGDHDWLKRAAKDAGIKRFAIKESEAEIGENAYIHYLAGKN